MGELVQTMDELGVVRAGNGVLRYDNEPGSDAIALEFARRYPQRFIPFAGQVTIRDLILREGQAAWDVQTGVVQAYLDALEEELRDGRWSGIGELFVKNVNTHPASDFIPTQYPADSPLMRRLWHFSATYGVPLSVHMEAEARHLVQMERLLKSNRQGTWLWAHTGYFAEPDLLHRLFAEHSNLYAELSWRDDVRVSRLGLPITAAGRLRPEWKELMEAYPERFVIGTDVTVGSLHEYRAMIRYWRGILEQLSSDAAAMLAYRNADRLLPT